MDNLPYQIIFRWDTEEARQKMIFDGHRPEAERYLQAVDQIQRSGNQSAIPIAMARLENEFRNILISRSKPISFLHHIHNKEEEAQHGWACFGRPRFNTSGSEKRQDDYDPFDDINFLYSLRLDKITKLGYSTDAINNLRCIAERMISSGHLCQCIEVYGVVRKSIIDATLRRLGIGYVKLPLEAKIRRWGEIAKVCVFTFFAREKKLCQEIFDGVGDDIAHACFMETMKEPAIQLLNFADAIFTTTTSSPQKLFRILDLYQALAHLMPHFDNIFDHKSCVSIRVLAANVLSRLSEAARETFFQFENSLLGKTPESEVPIPANGTIHPLTTFVMDYLCFICDYKQTLNGLIVPKPSKESIFTLDMHFAQEEGEQRLAIYLTLIIGMLLIKLEGKRKQYKDESLSHLFVMNNVHYISKRVRGHSELRDTIADCHLKKLERKFYQAANSYEKSTWKKVLDCLTEEGLYLKKDGKMSISKSALRKKIKAFNVLFEKVHRTHAVWSIPDLQLRSSLQMSITKKLIPAYKSFVRRHGNIEFSGTYVMGYANYSQLDLHAAVLDFFQGKPTS